MQTITKQRRNIFPGNFRLGQLFGFFLPREAGNLHNWEGNKNKVFDLLTEKIFVAGNRLIFECEAKHSELYFKKDNYKLNKL